MPVPHFVQNTVVFRDEMYNEQLLLLLYEIKSLDSTFNFGEL